MTLKPPLIDEQRFSAEILGAAGPVVVDFSATWCPPCRAQEAILAHIAQEQPNRCRVLVVDVDQSPGLAEKYGVRSAPTLIVFAGGRPLRSHVGLASRAVVLQLLEAAEAAGRSAPGPRA